MNWRRRQSEHPTTALLAEQRLWAAVIFQALKDALMPDPPPGGGARDMMSSGIRRAEVGRARDIAIVWLLSDREGFPRACDLAGVEPVEVRRLARSLIESGADASSIPATFDVGAADREADLQMREVRCAGKLRRGRLQST